MWQFRRYYVTDGPRPLNILIVNLLHDLNVIIFLVLHFEFFSLEFDAYKYVKQLFYALKHQFKPLRRLFFHRSP